MPEINDPINPEEIIKKLKKLLEEIHEKERQAQNSNGQ